MTIEHAADHRSARLVTNALDFIPAEHTIRPLRDQIILEPMDTEWSKTLYVQFDTKPLRGKVLAIGPGVYPTQYLDKDHDRLPDHARGRRKYSAHGTVFRATVVKVGEIIELGGLERRGNAYDGFMWGNRYCITVREEDVTGIIEHAT